LYFHFNFAESKELGSHLAGEEPYHPGLKVTHVIGIQTSLLNDLFGTLHLSPVKWGMGLMV